MEYAIRSSERPAEIAMLTSNVDDTSRPGMRPEQRNTYGVNVSIQQGKQSAWVKSSYSGGNGACVEVASPPPRWSRCATPGPAAPRAELRPRRGRLSSRTSPADRPTSADPPPTPPRESRGSTASEPSRPAAVPAERARRMSGPLGPSGPRPPRTPRSHADRRPRASHGPGVAGTAAGREGATGGKERSGAENRRGAAPPQRRTRVALTPAHPSCPADRDPAPARPALCACPCPVARLTKCPLIVGSQPRARQRPGWSRTSKMVLLSDLGSHS
ncbi:DUF397 domain-containing protein [Streptomyces sp. M19]